MFHKLLSAFEAFAPARRAQAHCDVPCSIYDPYMAQLAAHTIIRMNSLINDAKMDPNAPVEERKKFIHALSRYTAVKEEHAELVKKEIRIIWGDYFKPEHLKEYGELHDLTWKIMKSASKARQEVSSEAAQALLADVQRFAEIFWKTKGRQTARIPAPSPLGGEIVVAK